jgi:hypothetical protein
MSFDYRLLLTETGNRRKLLHGVASLLGNPWNVAYKSHAATRPRLSVGIVIASEEMTLDTSRVRKRRSRDTRT